MRHNACHSGQAARSGARAGIHLSTFLDSGSAAHRYTLRCARNDSFILDGVRA